MGGYQRYETYQDSGVEWLGEIPKHWELKKLHHIARLRSGETMTSIMMDSNYEFPVYGGNGLRGYYNAYTHDGEYVLIGRQGALCGNINYANGKFWASEHAVVASPSLQIDTFWFGELLRTMNLNQYSTSAAQPGISAELIGRLKMPFPPLEEQKSIARFLDYKTAQIDALIAKKASLLKKLAEKRSALISQAVTKGLDPRVPMKDSGVEWLGEVPAHWKLLPLKHAITFQRGHDLPADKRTEGDIPLVSSSGISSCHNVAAAKGPGIVTGRYGTIGKFHFIEDDYWPLNTTLYSIRTYENNLHFLRYMLCNLTALFLLNSQKSAVPGIDRNDLHPVLVALPSVDEQDRIVEVLDQWMTQSDLQVAKTQQAIDRLKEYRTALITNAVTGSIDVRNVPIPNDLQEAES
jgi:type I restriction enzyme, S subunit